MPCTTNAYGITLMQGENVGKTKKIYRRTPSMLTMSRHAANKCSLVVVLQCVHIDGLRHSKLGETFAVAAIQIGILLQQIQRRRILDIACVCLASGNWPTKKCAHFRKRLVVKMARKM